MRASTLDGKTGPAGRLSRRRKGNKMRRNNRNNRRTTGAGATGPAARTERPVYTAQQQERMQTGLRILARIIARAHLRRQSTGTAPELPPDQEAGG